MHEIKFETGLSITPTINPLGFEYGSDCFGPLVENRRLDDIRKSLFEPNCEGPEIVYSIAMDVGKKTHIQILNDLNLLFGIVTYSAGKLGQEPIRSQGHVHKLSSISNLSTPEVYEIWNGEAIIYMQKSDKDNPGLCYAVYGKPGDVIIVPPNWVHATISANPNIPLTFGAWCDRDYGFDYEGVRKHKGIAWFPIYDEQNVIKWIPNPNYEKSELICKTPNLHPELGIEKGLSIYQIFEKKVDTFNYVPFPELKKEVWVDFIP
ncbi:MAG: glucose-6-phosphate isomerase family protein [Bacteroidales bacterium]|nr:glucose-6-phosphate isomerase [Bacteroidales bacterium]